MIRISPSITLGLVPRHAPAPRPKPRPWWWKGFVELFRWPTNAEVARSVGPEIGCVLCEGCVRDIRHCDCWRDS